MLKIRLQRVGRIHEPSFRLVLTDSKNSSKSGRFGEVLGSYDPRKDTDSLKPDRIKHWLSKGIALTPSVHNLLIKHGVISGEKIHVSKNLNPQPTTDNQQPVVETTEVKDDIIEPVPVVEEEPSVTP